MSVALMSWFVILCIFSYVEKATAENYPLIEIDDGQFLSFPNNVEIIDSQIIFSYGSSKKVTYWCTGAGADIISKIPNEEYANHLREYCLFKKSFDTDQPRCDKKVKPFMLNYKEYDTKDKKIRCGPKSWGKQKGLLHGFAYLTCAPPANGFPLAKYEATRLNMIDFCYDHSENRILYTSHRILSPLILQKVADIEVLTHCDSDEISTDGGVAFGDEFETMKQEIKSNGLKPHMSAPLEDMALGIWKEPFLHYANVIGMPEEISILWNFIDAQIRKTAIELNQELEIYMGTFNAAKRNHKFWCKIVYAKMTSSSVAIIVHDAQTNPNKLDVLKEENCIDAGCKFNEWDKVDSVKEQLKFARCCKISKHILDLFGVNNIKKFYLNLNSVALPESIPFLDSV